MNATALPNIQGHKILVVDDTPANLELAVAYLEQHGFQVMVAQSGQAATSRAQLIQPDLILLDVIMPGIDGFETCRRLKANDNTQDIPVIFMTALTDLDDKVAGFAAGGVDFISKPFQVEELLARVKTHLTLRQAQKQLVTANTELRISEVRYRRLFETAKDGIVLFDFDSGRVTDVNATLVNLLGYEREHFVGSNLWEIPPFAGTADYASIHEALSHSEYVRREHWSLEIDDTTNLEVEFVASVYQVGDAKVVQCNIRDITDRKQAEMRIRYMALHDALTGLPNRILLHERLSQAIVHARRDLRKVAVLMLDLDHFKHINDSLGHHVGDCLLEATAVRLRACVRESDIVARLGGDEFVIALPGIDNEHHAATVAQKVIDSLCVPFHIEEHELQVGVSVGISQYPDDGEDSGILLRAADAAMYEAKAKGRRTYRLFTAELNDAAQRHLILSNDVRHAHTRGQLILHYQPQTAVETGMITGVEALLRWHHPTQGMIFPLEFIPMLEEQGHMLAVGQWVLETACLQNAAWQRDGLEPIRMAVNLSAHQFQRGDIVRTVSQALDKAQLAPQWLDLELPETMTLDGAQTTIDVMRGLKELGVSLSLADFGTGSSLSYLRQLPLDRIKIDRSFMRDLAYQTGSEAVIQGIIHLARNLGLACVAEGVETVEQLGYLQKEMCAEMQGFLFSPALPAFECGALLRTRQPSPDTTTTDAGARSRSSID